MTSAWKALMPGPKKIRSLTAAAVFVLCSITVFPSALEAQGRGEPGNRPGREDMPKRMEQMQKLENEKQFERLCNYLKLDKKQQKKARKLFDDMQKKTEKVARELRKGKLNETEAGEKRIKIYMDYRKKFRALLSQEQNEIYEKLRETGLKSDS
jgi:hypothetical protein